MTRSLQLMLRIAAWAAASVIGVRRCLGGHAFDWPYHLGRLRGALSRPRSRNFREQGLTVDLPVNEEQNHSFAAQASSGHLDGGATTIDALLAFRSPDFCFKSVVGLDESGGGDGVLTDATVTRISDLKGKMVAFNEGSTSQFLLDYLLRKNGMTERDLTVTNMTADEAAVAFIAHHVPAAVTWEPNLTFARTHNAGHLLIDSRQTPGIIVDLVKLN